MGSSRTRFTPALSVIAAAARASVSLGVTDAAPATAAAMATRPDPDARSSTTRPRTQPGWSSRYRASAWPPAHGNAQNGGGSWSCPVSRSIRSHSPNASRARYSRISGSSGGAASQVLARMNAAGACCGDCCFRPAHPVCRGHPGYSGHPGQAWPLRRP